MHALKFGPITNPKTGVTKEIVVKTMPTNSIVDILVGGGMVLTGIAHLTITAFMKGAKKYEEAELQTLSDLDLM